VVQALSPEPVGGQEVHASVADERRRSGHCEEDPLRARADTLLGDAPARRAGRLGRARKVLAAGCTAAPIVLSWWAATMMTTRSEDTRTI
jgi:hypothetical protein